MVRKPPSERSVSTVTSSRASSNYPPSVFSAAGDADDDDTLSMSTDDLVSSRPLSVAIPKTKANSVHGPFCPRRPNLREILANTSEAPWTLAAFMAYLSTNHCLELLEFTMDAGRYKKHYAKMMSRAGSGNVPPIKDREYVQALWDRLVEAYIQPSGSREVNLTSDVRDPITNLRPAELPPAPEKLDPAVSKIYELMEESVLVPFLNSVYPSAPPSSVSTYGPISTSDESLHLGSRGYGGSSAYQRRVRYPRDSSPPQSAIEPHSRSYNPPSPIQNRRSAPSGITNPHKARYDAKLAQRTSAASTNISAMSAGSDANVSASGTTDDSGSLDSPMHDSPTSPPVTPFSGDWNSPKRDSGMWKKLGRFGGMKSTRKKSDGKLRDDQ